MNSSFTHNESSARSLGPSLSSKNSRLDDSRFYSAPKFVFGQGNGPNFSSKSSPLDNTKHCAAPKFVFGQGIGPNFSSKSSLLNETKHYTAPKFVFGQGGAPKKPPVKTAQQPKIFLPPQTMSARDFMMGLHLSNYPSSPSYMGDPRETGRSCIPRPSSPSQINPFGPDEIPLGNDDEYMDDGYSYESSCYSAVGTNTTFSQWQR